MYELQKNRWLKHIDFAILDILTMECLYLLLAKLLISKKEWDKLGVHKQVAVAIPVVALILYVAYDFHRKILHRKLLMELACCIQYVSCVCGGVLIYLYLSKDAWKFSRKLFILYWVTAIPVLLLIRRLYRMAVVRRVEKTAPSMILITDRPVDVELMKSIDSAEMRCRLSAIFTDLDVKEPFREVYALDIAELETYRNTNAIDEVILDLKDQERYDEWLNYLLDSGLAVHVRIDYLSNGLPNAMIEKIGGLTVLSTSNSVAYPGQLILKRIMDIAGSLVGLVFTGAAFLVFAPVIRTQSPGPVFYSQIRVGRNGRQFRIYKFRSMYPDADARKNELMKDNKMEGQMFKLDNDPRIIPIGHFIRKHSIDELPQFLNVLKGDMSLVGTRPPTLDEWERYSPHHRARMSAKPGLTGLWQVSGRSEITDFEEIVRMDTEYINNWSLMTDIRLLAKTVVVVFRGDGAA